jgi:phosphatidylinositol alpha-mannosyltransferase
MRVCVVSDLYYPYPGGISEHVHHTAYELSRRGHEVTILTTNYPNLNIGAEAGNEEKVRIVRVGRAMPRPTNKSMGIMPIGFGLSRKVKQVMNRGFDIVHVHGMSPFLPLMAAKYSTGVNILTFHGSMPGTNMYKYVAFLLQAYIRKAHAIIAVSNEALETLKRFVRDNHTITPVDNDLAGFVSGRYVNVRYKIIPNGIDASRFSPRAKAFSRFSSGGPNILFVGRFEPRKGLNYLLEAFPEVQKQLPEARLIIVGKGWRDRTGNPATGSTTGAKNVFFEGFVTRELLPRYYASCDVYCSPATGRESFGIVLLEGMASGKPVIASDIPGYRDVVTHGSDGLLVKPEDPKALAQTLIKVLTNKELSTQLSKHGPETATRYSWDRVTRDIEEFYHEMLSTKRDTAKVGDLILRGA